eukprot:TRINITY_DN1785_c0_g1_i1.p1 TRINITY_DN1785_c0_g1~~TRINITY_DN1785_c0_g1_i1.p1  ORF type:complete len:532 (+),score=127.75 TRINITY_DN1785_c0_g1_i1:635-2230(+)
MCPMHLLPIISYLSQYTIIMRVMLLASMLWCVLAADKPHVLLVFADDFGWANVGLHTHDDEVVTPNIDAYAAQGIELDRHYAYKFCSPSRSSLQSGRLPVNVNVENASPTVSNPADPVGGYAGIPVNMTTLAWKMRQAGYRAHMTGKWDAGMATPMHTPIGRGYESWLGYFHHANDYWTEKLPFQSTGTVDVCGNAFVDLWLNNGPALGMNGTVYEEELFTNNTLNIIRQHDPKEPLFLFHAFHLMHTPLQVPQSYLDQFPFIHGSPNQRKPYAAMVKYMDDALGLIVGILKDKAMWDNLLMIFVSDNGGPIYYPGGGNNYPLKGGKMSDWEGGVRVNAFISGGYVPKELQGTKSESYVHVADWYPTLCKLVGVDYYDEAAAKAGLHQVDGVPVLDHFFKKNATVPRTMIHLSDQALIQGEWKVLVGQQVMTGWQGPYYPNATGLQPLYNKDSPVDDWKHECGTGCLYNIIEDPNETNNLALTNGNKLQELTSKLADLNKGNYNPNRGQGDPRACQQAIKYGGFYGPWIDL